MPIKYIKKWECYKFDDFIDVRSPLEYKEDHIPNSINLPVLNDIQREKIGTIYKKDNAFKARKLGAALVSKNISNHLKKYLLDKPGNWKPLIYCWRGGQRSKSMATVLEAIGWQVYVLQGGYKTYRVQVNSKISKICKKIKFIVIKGPTGTGKTRILSRLKKMGISTLDLEGIANHKGSLLGSIPNKKQPSQKLFESLIYLNLKNLLIKNPVFIEAESSKVGNLYLPKAILNGIKNQPMIIIEANIKERIKFLVNDYKQYVIQENSFKDLFIHAERKIGFKAISEWKKLYTKKNWKKLALLLITEYYDPMYSHNFKITKNKVLKSYKLSKLDTKHINIFCNKLKNDLKIFT